MNNNKKLFTTVLFVAASSLANSKTLTIGIDLSGSSPVTTIEAFAARSAQKVSEKIRALQFGDWLKIKTFGELGASNLERLEIRIDRRNRQKKIAESVRALIEAIPRQQLTAQPSTNLVSWLEFQDFDCASGSEVILLTDGIESSEYVTATKFVNGGPLPAPAPGLLAGCEVTMIGIGQTAEGSLFAKEIKHVRSEWNGWMKIAGAKFTAVIE